MGIDVYMRWKGQSEEEEEAQYTGFSIHHGHVGYLREAYHGGPYATQVLVPEAFDEELQIDAHILRQRLPRALEAVETRTKTIYPSDSEEDIAKAKKSFIDFVELAERKQQETGEFVTICVSA